jgi:hypothetical protein
LIMARAYDPELWELEEELGELESGLWAEDEAVYEALMKGPFPPPRSPVLSGRAPVPRRSLLRPVLNCPTPTHETVSGFSRYSNSVASLPASEQIRVKNVASLIIRSFRPSCQPIVAVHLVGHADYDPFRERREPGFMMRISRARALAVKQALERLINNRAIASRIVWDVRGVGAGQLVVRNPITERERMRNRRVEIFASTERPSWETFDEFESDRSYLSPQVEGVREQSEASGPRAEVRALQESINKWRVENGQTPIKEDGLLSAETNRAVLEFQKASGLKREDGIAGPFTRERLTLLLDILKNIPTSPVWTVGRRRLIELVGSAGFRSLAGPTQTEVLKRILSYQRSPGALDKIRHLTNLVTQTGFELLPTSSQKLMLRVLAARPEDTELAFHLGLLAERDDFRNLEGPTQTWVLKRIEGYAGDRRKIDNLVTLITLNFLFGGLPKKIQKLMLVAHANHPEDTRLVEDFLTLAGRNDFSQLDQPTQTEVLYRILGYPRGPGNVENLMNLVTTPGFGNLAPDVRAQVLDGLPSRFGNVWLNPASIGNMMSLITALGFEKIRPDVRDLMLDVHANRPDNVQLANALRDEIPRIRRDPRMARPTILRVDDSIP